MENRTLPRMPQGTHQQGKATQQTAVIVVCQNRKQSFCCDCFRGMLTATKLLMQWWFCKELDYSQGPFVSIC